MSVKKAMPPPSDRQTTTARALVVACAALGIIALAVGFWILSAGGQDVRRAAGFFDYEHQTTPRSPSSRMGGEGVGA
jgi:hypothetical protein